MPTIATRVSAVISAFALAKEVFSTKLGGTLQDICHAFMDPRAALVVDTRQALAARRGDGGKFFPLVVRNATAAAGLDEWHGCCSRVPAV
jgi:hypothetical protein